MPHLVHKKVLVLSAWIYLKWSMIRLWGSRPAPIKRPRCPTSDLGPALRAHLEQLNIATILWKCPPTHTPQSPHHHSLSDPRPLKAALLASYHRTLRGLRFKLDNTNVPNVIFRCVLGDGSYPLTRQILRAFTTFYWVWRGAQLVPEI